VIALSFAFRGIDFMAGYPKVACMAYGDPRALSGGLAVYPFLWEMGTFIQLWWVFIVNQALS